ncbi:hypothetical protein EV182_003667, partial [Spiromyces aspiralis]
MTISKPQPVIYRLPVKWVVLGMLSAQNSLLTLVMTYSRRSSVAAPYLASTAVLLSELVKTFISLTMVFLRDNSDGCDTLAAKAALPMTRRLRLAVRTEVLTDDAWKSAIPALLYTVQNNLQYIAAGNLDAATFQVTYQLKILATALCAVVMLKAALRTRQWVSLFLLTLGVALVQFQHGTTTTAATSTSAARDATVVPDTMDHHQGYVRPASLIPRQLVGLAAVFLACLSSGLSGVYFEKILKGNNKTSLWARNVQLSAISVAIATLGILIFDMGKIARHGFFYGYDRWAVAAITCQSTGGILAALVIKYADNILKGFATSIAIIFSSVISIWLLEFHPGLCFVIGTIIV